MRIWLLTFLVLISGCTHTPAPYKVNTVSRNQYNLPCRLVTTERGMQKIQPSVWEARTKKFRNEKKYNVVAKKGDTVYSLSKKHGIPMRTIILNNNLHAPFGLRIGKKLTLTNPRAHKVNKGDTLYSIAKLHNVDVSALAHTNNLKAPFALRIGQELALPAPVSLDTQGTFVPHLKKKKPAPKKKKIVPAPQKKSRKAPAHKKLSPKEKRKYAQPAKRASSTFLRPVKGKVTSHYGPRKNGTQNDGINIAAPMGTKVKAAENGVVVYTGNEISSYGNLVLVKHSGGWVSTYGHLKNISVKRGTHIKRGQSLGTVGKSGHVKTPQLHFELRKGRWPVNPATYLSR